MGSFRPFLLFLLSQTQLTGALAGGAPEPGNPRCESRSPTFDSREITCFLPASGGGRFRLRVDFSGGHDDTMAAMSLSLGGVALACEPGSKTRLMGEDGDVNLFCAFSLDPRAAATALRAVVTWSHAEYTGHELVAE